MADYTRPAVRVPVLDFDNSSDAKQTGVSGATLLRGTITSVASSRNRSIHASWPSPRSLSTPTYRRRDLTSIGVIPMLGGYLRQILQTSDMKKTSRKSHFDPMLQDPKEDTTRARARQFPVPVQHVQQAPSLLGRKGVNAIRPNGRRAKERKRQPRIRDHLEDREAESFEAAIRFANHIGHPITHFITIIPNRLGREAKTGTFQEQVMEDAVIAFMGSLTGLMDRRDIPRIYTWVRENTVQGGEHLHIGVHIPPDSEDSMIAGIARILKAPRGSDRDLNASKGEIARSRKRGWLVQRVLFGLTGALGLAEYVSKGTEKGAQGWTKGKRCGVARMLDVSARQKRNTT